MQNRATLKRRNLRTKSALLLAAGTAIVGLSQAAHAADGSWNVNASGNWSDPANWLGGAVADEAGSTANLTFDINGAKAVTVDATGFTVGTLNIGDGGTGASAYTLASGTGTLTLNNSGSTAVINHTVSAGPNVIAAPLFLAGDAQVNSFSSSTGRGLTVLGGITGTGNLNLSVQGTIAMTLSTGTLNFNGTITNNGTNTGTAVISAGIDSGITAINQSSTQSATSISGAITIGASGLTITNTLGGKAINLTGGLSGAGNVVLNNNSVLTSGIFSSVGTINNAGTILSSGSGTGSVNIVNIGSAVTGVTQNGTGTLALTGVNSSAGGVTLQAGTLIINHANALGTGNFYIGAGTTINNSAAGLSNAGNNTQTWAGNFAFTGSQNLDLGAGNVTLAGGPMTLTASASNLTIGGQVLTASGNGLFDITKAGSGIVTFTQGQTLTATQTANVTTGTMTLNGALTGLDGIFSVNKLGGGTLIYNPAIALTANQMLTVAAGVTQLSGVISGNGFGLTFVGGTARLGGANTYNGGTTVTTGTLNISGAAAGSASSNVVVNSGTTLTFDSASAAGTNRAASVLLNGGATFNVNGNATANTLDNVLGTITAAGLQGGYNIISLAPNAARNATLTAAAIDRTAGGVVLLRGTSLGGSALSASAIGSSNISLSSGPALIGGGGSTATNVSIIPWAIGGTSTGDQGSTFVTYDANGIRPLALAEFATSVTDGGLSTDNARLTANTSFTQATTINSLILQPSAATTVSGGTLRITSGAVLLNPGNTNVNLNVSSGLDFGSAQGVIGFSSNRAVTLNSVISGSGGLVLYAVSTSGGSGAIQIGGAADYTGDTYIFGKINTWDPNAPLFFPNAGRGGDMYVSGQFNFANNTVINGLNGSGYLFYGHSGTGTITVGSNGADGNFSGQIANTANFNTINLIKTGAGTQILSGTNSFYGGSTQAREGVLQISAIANGGVASSIGSSTNGAGNLVINGGTLRYVGGATSTDRLFTVGGTLSGGGGTLDASGTGALNFTNTGALAYGTAGTTGTAQKRTLTLGGTNTSDNTLAALIGQNGIATNGNSDVSLNKIDDGTWVITGANTYRGSTTIGDGNLKVASGGQLGATLTADVFVLDGGTLTLNTGTGIDDLADLSIASGGIVALNGGTEMVYSLFLNGGLAAAGTWGSTASLADNKNDTYFSGTGMISAVPEPASLGLLVIGGLSLLKRRRRAM